jgi:hypothetical protein
VLVKRSTGYEERWQCRLIQGIQSGEFPSDLDVKVVTFVILGRCNWRPRWYRQEERLSIDDTIQPFTRLVLHGVRCRLPD